MTVLSNIERALGLTNGLVGMFKSGGDVAGTILELKTLLLTVQQEKLATEQKLYAAQQESAQLRQAMADITQFELDMKDYAPHALPSGAWVMVQTTGHTMQPGNQASQPVLYLCQACFHKRERSVLQPKANSSENVLGCHVCGSEILVERVKGCVEFGPPAWER